VSPSPEIIEEILYEFKRTRSPFKTAKNVGIDVTVVLQVIDDNTDRIVSGEERWGGEGRPELLKFRVGKRKAASAGWDNTEPAIAEARTKFEAGTHTMCTGRDGAWLLLYSIPLRKLDPKPGYFLPEFSI
jgi:hypothetical protein